MCSAGQTHSQNLTVGNYCEPTPAFSKPYPWDSSDQAKSPRGLNPCHLAPRALLPPMMVGKGNGRNGFGPHCVDKCRHGCYPSWSLWCSCKEDFVYASIPSRQPPTRLKRASLVPKPLRHPCPCRARRASNECAREPRAKTQG